MSPPDIFYSGVDFPLLDPASRMELWLFYVGLLFLVGLFLPRLFVEPFSTHIYSGFQDVNTPQLPERVWKPEAWCLVSETVLGRTCVRSNACSPENQYASEEACTLTEASSLPLGIADPLARFYRPFMSPYTHQTNTY